MALILIINKFLGFMALNLHKIIFLTLSLEFKQPDKLNWGKKSSVVFADL